MLNGDKPSDKMDKSVLWFKYKNKILKINLDHFSQVKKEIITSNTL